MKKLNFTQFFLLVHLLAVVSFTAMGQTPWSGAYGNEWIVPGQQYAVVKVKAKGVYQINKSELPQSFPAFDAGKLQLWHRGKQVAILEQDASKVVFYGVPNDGASDELLARRDPARPAITSRMNKFVSLFSDHSFYYLTVDTRASGSGFEPPVGVQTVDLASLGASSMTEQYHIKEDTIKYTNEFSTSGTYSTYPSLFNSFYDYSQTFTGLRQLRNATFLAPFQLKNLNRTVNVPVKVKILLHNRGNTNFNLAINIKAKNGVNRQVTTVSTLPFKAHEYEFQLNLGTDLDVKGEGELSFNIPTPAVGDWYSIAAISFTYPQNFNADGKTLYEFGLPNSTKTGVSSITLDSTAVGNIKLLDVTNTARPIILSNNNLPTFNISRVQNEAKKLLFYTGPKEVPATNIYSFVGRSKNVNEFKDNDYVIITSQALLSGAQRYADYRASTYNRTTKANFKPLVLTVEDIYNQYNYGEPSPVALRRCIDFLISGGNVNKSLFLIGNSNNLNKGIAELKDQVPAIGYPGSDFLLVSGLANTHEDFQTISVGRLPVGTVGKVDDYLSKVMQYENYSDIASKAWRKNVVHYSGGKYTSEVNSLKNRLETAANNYVTPFSGTTFSYNKDPNNPCPADHDGYVDCQTSASPEIATKVNEGAGVLTYFGHGNTRVTDYYTGYVTDPSKGFNNSKYAAYFLYGCDVNNVYGANNENISYVMSNSAKRPFVIDWLITPNKGAITVVGNSWEGYEGILTPYLNKTYERLFVQDINRPMIGDLLRSVSNTTMSPLIASSARVAAIAPDNTNYNYNFTQANVHQTVLLGDPAIILLLTTSPSSLPVTWLSVTAKPVNFTEVKVEWSTASETNNEKFIIQRSIDGKTFEDIGTVDGRGDVSHQSDYSFLDTRAVLGKSYYRIVQVDRASSDGESNTSKSRIVTVDNQFGESILVFPNPSGNTINIASPLAKVLSWELVNILGSTVKSGDEIVVDLSGLPDGAYFLKLKTHEGVVVKRFVKSGSKK